MYFLLDILQNSKTFTGTEHPSAKPGGFNYFDIASGTPVDTRDSEGRYIYQSAYKSGDYFMM